MSALLHNKINQRNNNSMYGNSLRNKNSLCENLMVQEWKIYDDVHVTMLWKVQWKNFYNGPTTNTCTAMLHHTKINLTKGFKSTQRFHILRNYCRPKLSFSTHGISHYFIHKPFHSISYSSIHLSLGSRNSTIHPLPCFSTTLFLSHLI